MLYETVFNRNRNDGICASSIEVVLCIRCMFTSYMNELFKCMNTAQNVSIASIKAKHHSHLSLALLATYPFSSISDTRTHQ